MVKPSRAWARQRIAANPPDILREALARVGPTYRKMPTRIQVS